jgi:hypothetical protein
MHHVVVVARRIEQQGRSLDLVNLVGGVADDVVLAAPGGERESPRKVLGFGNCKRMFFWGHMQRREFITLIGGVAIGWSQVASAQQSDKPRLISVLMG